MAASGRLRPVHGLALACALVPVWKAGSVLLERGPSLVSIKDAHAGRELFVRQWTANDPLTGGDGLGPVFNSRSCVDCHMQGGPGGGGPIARNVTVYGLSEAH